VISPVVDFSWLNEHRREVVLADVRWYLDGRSGLVAYEEGHIPGAVFIDLDTCLAGPGGNDVGRHPLPIPSFFSEAMSENGIGDGATVVAYDDAGGVIAARLVWMLRALGENAALLDGGLKSYTGTLAVGDEKPPHAKFSPRLWLQDRLATIDDASDARNVVLDARNRDRYQGENEPVDPRSGHIPGAINLPCRENLNPDGTFLPVQVLRQRFEDAGVGEGKTVISYCGSGVTACHNLLAMEWAGLGTGRLFPGSWSQYSYAADRRVSTGSEPK
jgi:thiosulfate/3-mercaptopyruvate sulfurtransferase